MLELLSLLDSLKSMLDKSLADLKRSRADTADNHLKEIKKLKFDDPHRFKKKGNEDQYRSNLKVGDAIEEAKEPCSSQQLDKVHASLEKEDSDYEKNIIRAEARARTQAKQNLPRNKSRFASNRREPSALTPVAAATPTQFFSNSARPIPTIQPRTQTKPGSCYTCNKPGHWRAQCPLNPTKFQSGQ